MRQVKKHIVMGYRAEGEDLEKWGQGIRQNEMVTGKIPTGNRTKREEFKMRDREQDKERQRKQ